MSVGGVIVALVPMRGCGDKTGVRWSFAPLVSLMSLALPPRCPGCATPVERDHRFCADCWRDLRFIAPPWCAACNRPFDFARGEGAWCGGCLADAPRHAGVRAPVAYGPIARRLALKLKYGGKIGVADTMASFMMRTMPEDIDLLVPVPLHRWRLWSRGFNQAVLIARALARKTGTPLDVDSLVRHRSTIMLRGLGGAERRRAVAGAFRIADARAIAGRSIALVDDVYASGATAHACTAALLRAGATRVTILCWARVLDDPDAAVAASALTTRGGVIT